MSYMPVLKARALTAFICLFAGALCAVLSCTIPASPTEQGSAESSHPPQTAIDPSTGGAPGSLAESPSRGLARPAAIQSDALTIYLPRLFEDGSLGLRAVSRPAAHRDDRLREALEALIAGPDGDERASAFQYPLQPRTRLRSIAVNGGTAVVDFETGIDRVHGRPYSELVYWAIVHTVTEVAGVDRVTLSYRGDVLRDFGDPAVPIGVAAGRADAPDWVRPR